MNQFSIQVRRNLRGKDLEKTGDIEGAINLYELNISERFEGSHPYSRLAIIYSKKKLVYEEIRVLKKGIEVLSHLHSEHRADIDPKIAKFKLRLEKVENKLKKI